MDLFIKENGKIIAYKELEFCGMILEIFISVSLKKIRQVVLESSFSKMEADMKENGMRICSMGKEKRFGMMVPTMSETTKKA